MYQYLAFSRVALKEAVAFRVNLFTSVLGGLFQLILLTSIWKAIYVSRHTLAGYNESEILFYIVVATAMSAGGLLTVGPIIGAKSDSGDIVVDMARPVSVPWSYFFSTLGVYALRFWTKGVPTLLIGFILIGHIPAVQLHQVLLFLLVLLGGSFLHFCLNLGVGSFAFRTKSAYGLTILWNAMTAFLAGLMVPIAFYPEALRNVVGWTPFPSVAYTPIGILMGDETAVGGLAGVYKHLLGVGPAVAAVMEQITWIAVVLPLAFAVYRWNERATEAQGG